MHMHTHTHTLAHTCTQRHTHAHTHMHPQSPALLHTHPPTSRHVGACMRRRCAPTGIPVDSTHAPQPGFRLPSGHPPPSASTPPPAGQTSPQGAWSAAPPAVPSPPAPPGTRDTATARCHPQPPHHHATSSLACARSPGTIAVAGGPASCAPQQKQPYRVPMITVAVSGGQAPAPPSSACVQGLGPLLPCPTTAWAQGGQQPVAQTTQRQGPLPVHSVPGPALPSSLPAAGAHVLMRVFARAFVRVCIRVCTCVCACTCV